MSDGIDGVKPGARIFCGDDVRTVDRRKDDDSGWWLTDGSGLADWVADGDNWCLLEGSAPFEAGRASVLQEQQQGVDRIAQAIGDPGSIVGYRDWDNDESIPRWSTRAVLAVLAERPARTVSDV